MLKIVNNGFKKPTMFQYEVDGEARDLNIVQMDVADDIRFHKLQKEVMDDETLSEEQKQAKWLQAKVACSVKEIDGGYVFDLTSELPSEVIMALLPYINDLNPLPAEEGLEGKKKKS